MTGQTLTRDDVVSRVMDAFQDESAQHIIDWIDSRERIIKKKDLDFQTIVEVAKQINAKSLDIENIESYSMSMVMGQFGILRVFFMRQTDFSSPTIRLQGKSRKLPKISFEIDSALGRLLVDAAEPILLSEEPGLLAEHPVLKEIGEAGIEVLLPLVRAEFGTFQDLKGCLCIGPKLGDRDFQSEDLEFLKLLSNMIAVSLHNAQLYHRSIIDHLTRVYSRGHFDIHLDAEVRRAEDRRKRENDRRKGGSGETEGEDKPSCVSLVLLDIDHFKRFNDTYGHLIGDLVLQEAAQLFNDSVRKMDVVARYGGEEFALILPETNKQDAITLAERLRSGLEAHRVMTDGKALQVTASFGIATFPYDALTVRELVAQSDLALYSAKEAGRNRVMAVETIADRAGQSG